jgi:hypothetical protein
MESSTPARRIVGVKGAFNANSALAVLDRFSIRVKRDDKRAGSYVATYGDHCWEADILPGDIIGQTIDRDIHSWLDVKAWKRRDKEIQQARELL